jgi:hypothetical protein
LREDNAINLPIMQHKRSRGRNSFQERDSDGRFTSSYNQHGRNGDYNDRGYDNRSQYQNDNYRDQNRNDYQDFPDNRGRGRGEDDYNTYRDREGNDYRRVSDDRYDYNENDQRSYNNQYNHQYNRDNQGYRDYDDYNRHDYNDYDRNEDMRRRGEHDGRNGYGRQDQYNRNDGRERDWGGSGNRDMDTGSYDWNQRNGGSFEYENPTRRNEGEWDRDREGGSHHGDYSRRGFASMPRSEVRRIASMGGKASHGGQSHRRGGRVSARRRSRSSR